MSAKSPANGDINPSPVKRSKRNADHPTGPRKVAIKSTSLSSNENAHARRHRKLIDQLTACGIQKYIPIPKITVLGSQSAGKSSILEALSGITFPRAAGTCTRCPTEVRLFSGYDDWVCTVSLRFEKDIEGNALDQVQTEQFGDEIKDPDQVQHRLKQAQRAILNPNKPLEEFLLERNDPSNTKIDDTVGNEIQFSENVICIEIKGKTRDLSVVDLPGLIANVADDENVENINLIERLAIREISKPESVVLLCVTMSEDFQNQPAVRLAKDADPKGNRTLGVLTKPDRIEDGNFEMWQPILAGEKQPLHHGYYVVKNPDPKQLGEVTRQEARQDEEDFFAKEPWSSLGPHLRSRLGSDRLSAKLSGLLEEMVKLRTPAILKKIQASYEKVTQGLSRLAPKIEDSDAQRVLQSKIMSFHKDMDADFLNVDVSGTLAEELYTMRMQMWETMLNNRPRFLPVTQEEARDLFKVKAAVEDPSRLLDAYNFQFHRETRDLSSIDTESLAVDHAKNNDVKTWKDFLELAASDKVSKLDSASKQSPLVLNMTAVRALKARSTRDKLPDSISWEVKVEMTKLSTVDWPSITMKVLADQQKKIQEGCDVLIARHFGLYQVGALNTEIRCILEKIIVKAVKETESFLERLIKHEAHITTISQEDYRKQKDQLIRFYLNARLKCKLHHTSNVIAEQQPLPTLRCLYKQPNDPDEIPSAFLARLEEEIRLTAEVRAYWQIAMKQFTDQVQAALKISLVKEIVNQCEETLSEALGLFTMHASTKAIAYLQEDEQTRDERTRLLSRKITFERALQVISDYHHGQF